jgi:hypothetical protein
MKKRLLLLGMIGLLTSAVSVFADHPGNKLGIGLFFGGGYGSVGGGVYNPSLTLKIPDVDVFWGVNGYLGSYTGLGVTGDYYFVDGDLLKSGSFNLDWFWGLGGFGHFYFGGKSSTIAAGARMPLGLSWHLIKEVELFLNIAPGIGFDFTSPGVYWVGAGEFGLRFWL